MKPVNMPTKKTKAKKNKTKRSFLNKVTGGRYK